MGGVKKKPMTFENALMWLGASALAILLAIGVICYWLLLNGAGR